jgi:hypothetical protein
MSEWGVCAAEETFLSCTHTMSLVHDENRESLGLRHHTAGDATRPTRRIVSLDPRPQDLEPQTPNPNP